MAIYLEPWQRLVARPDLAGFRHSSLEAPIRHSVPFHRAILLLAVLSAGCSGAKGKAVTSALDTPAKVKETLASATQEWGQILTEIQSGELASAFGKGTALRLKVSEALMAVSLVADDPAWHNLTLPPKGS